MGILQLEAESLMNSPEILPPAVFLQSALVIIVQHGEDLVPTRNGLLT